MDRELQQSEERFRLLVESVADYAIFMLDPDGVIQTWNVGAERLKGYTEDEIVGRHYSTFYPEEDREAGLPDQLLETARTEGKAQYAGWRVRKDGTRFWANVLITALREEDGTLAGFAKVTRDMTEQHRAEQAREAALEQQARSLSQLEELDRWRRDFIGSVTHDLRNPTVSILGFARALAGEDELDPDERQVFAERIVSNAEALERLIDHLRTFAHLESGAVELEPERIDLRELVEELWADMEPVLDDRELVVAVEGVEVKADRAGVQRILRNLIGNAVEHTPAGSAIEVRARRDGGVVEVEVSDEGQGFSEDLAERIFDRYERGDGKGMGLGLSIVKQYVELHGGEVAATSAPGEGATFRFTLRDL